MWMKCGKKPEYNTDREIVWKAGVEVHMHFLGNRMESVGGYEDAGWTRCISKWTASPRATIRQLDGVRNEF